MITETTSLYAAAWMMATIAAGLGTILFFHLIIKPKQNEKAKSKVKGGKVVDIDTDKYDETECQVSHK